MPFNQGATADLNAAITADVNAAVTASADLVLMGWSATESDGTPAVATAKIVNGATGAAAAKQVHIELLASSSQQQSYGPNGIACPLGISIDWIAGTLDITLVYKTRIQ